MNNYENLTILYAQYRSLMWRLLSLISKISGNNNELGENRSIIEITIHIMFQKDRHNMNLCRISIIKHHNVYIITIDIFYLTKK
jgi:hypothetical protein